MKYFSLIVLALFNTVLLAQNYELDAIRFGTNNFSGTARYVAVGGAFSSVGADLSNLSHNPAGVGMYRNSIILGGLSFDQAKVNSTYLNNTETENSFAVRVGGIGAVFAQTSFKNLKSTFIQSAAFSIGMNRMANFTSSEKYSGFNAAPNSSITKNWVNEIGEINGNQEGIVDETTFSFEAVNGYQTFLVNFDTSLLTFTTPINNSISQTRFVDNRGGKNEIILSGGANYLDKLYFGATIGIPIVNYERNTRYIEEDTENSNGDFKDFNWNYNYSVTGVGFNFKAGIIYKPTDWVRIGAAIHTPERISLTEEYSSNIQSNFDSVSYEHNSPIGEFDYTVRLPWRANTGISFFYKRNGFISFDYELVDYTSTRYTFGQNFAEIAAPINDNLNNNYKVAHNFRAGIEGVIKMLRLRGGYNFIASPYKKDLIPANFNFSNHRVSGGFGILLEKVAVDLTAMYAFINEVEQPFTVDNGSVPTVQKSINPLSINITVAYRLR